MSRSDNFGDYNGPTWSNRIPGQAGFYFWRQGPNTQNLCVLELRVNPCCSCGEAVMHVRTPKGTLELARSFGGEWNPNRVTTPTPVLANPNGPSTDVPMLPGGEDDL